MISLWFTTEGKLEQINFSDASAGDAHPSLSSSSAGMWHL